MSATKLPEMPRGLVYDMSSEAYHSFPGTYSSSQLKKILEDEEVFYKMYIEKSIEKEHMSAFDVGTYFHTAILENHKLEEDTAVYPGVRRGKEWEAFKEANKNKCIITSNEREQAETLIKAVKDSPIAMARIGRCQVEVSAFVVVYVLDGEIYDEEFANVLGTWGWARVKKEISKADRKRAVKIPLKVRADALADDFVLDLKSTSGNTKNKFAMQQVVSRLNYQLSAALYLDIFTLATGRLMTEFVWTFASKDMGNSKTYIASADNIAIGRAMWKMAVIKLAGCIQSNWQFEDSLGELGPQNYEREYLQPKAEDLI